MELAKDIEIFAFENDSAAGTLPADVPVFGKRSPENFAAELEKSAQNLESATCAIDKQFQVQDVFTRRDDSKSSLNTSHSLLLEEWEGCIKEVYDDHFIAHLYKPDSDSTEVLEAEFAIDDVVPEGNRHLVVEGMIFYWNLGKEVKKSGTISNNDYLIFRRIPSWNNFDAERESETADNFFNFD
ncbi:MAG: hypothetical protein JXX14_16425 [Deltaproteobacteria bacterium]|nr:hypothetical protein [Deltaproteobacteria bacterium]